MSASRPYPGGRGFTILETTVSMVIVSLVLVAALGTVEATNRMRRIADDAPRAAMLAHDLMAEIMMTPSYEEPFGVADFGPEGLESGASRAAFDDVDDYHGWTRSPPEARDGTTLPGLTGWSRSVTVMLADPDDLTAASLAGDAGVKVVTVVVQRDGKEVAALSAVRTVSWRSFAE